MKTSFDIVGHSPARPDAADKACGRERYVGDMSLPRMLHAAVVRSTRAHARVLALDVTAARALPGVAAVLTARDIPGRNVIPIVFDDQPCLADGLVRYVGEALALVAAATPAQARAAAAAVAVQYEELPALFDPDAARRPGAPRIYKENNIFKELHILRGDPAGAWAQCAAVVDHIYRTPPQEHAYLETQGMLAVPQPGGVMQVYGSMQCPFYVREGVAAVLGSALGATQVTQTSTGGAFGGKEDVPSLPAAHAALLAWRTRRPVRLVYERDEDIACTSKRHAAVIRSKYGADRDGRLRAVEIEYLVDGGAYATLSPIVLFRGVVHAAGPYSCPHVRVDGYAVATNHVPAGAFRGFGSPQVLFAAERQMDELARQLKLDPVELRRRNLLRAGDSTITGQTLHASVGATETLDTALAFVHEHPVARPAATATHLKYGRGISTIYYGVGLGVGGEYLARTGATVQVNHDGSVVFAVGTTEMGQGMKTVLAQIVAEALGVPFARVEMLPTDTTRVPDSGPTVASRATTMSGNALLHAAGQLRERMGAVAAELLRRTLPQISLHNGQVFADGAPTTMSFAQLVHECAVRRVPLSAQGWHHPRQLSYDWQTGQGDAYVVFSFATNIAEVVVDERTGATTVLRVTAAHDVGKAINPAGVEGQIEGGTLQGIGYALTEEIVQANGVIRNPHFSTYIIPTACDMPEIVPLIVEQPFPDGPFGAKGFGEQPLMGVAPAIANAVCSATGVTLNELPLTPERVWAALHGG
jgi:CO/xanthine dehydrogenase Mo-binding subunit